MDKVKYLLSYRYAEIIHDLTVEFTKNYIVRDSGNLGHLRPDFRTADQMNQAARSGKQNIVEGIGQGRISEKGVIKLLGVANASFEDFLTDFEDFLRQNDLEIYKLTDPRVTKFRQIAFRLSNLNNLGDLGDLIEKPQLFGNPKDDANFLLTLCHQVTYLLNRQIKSVEDKFIQEGGYNEALARKRREFRKY